jgi:thiol:disulfide interchange protein DsbD
MILKLIASWSAFGTLAVLFSLLSHGVVFAQEDRAATEHVRAQLIASVDAVHPGEKILLGVQQNIVPGWHTYWINPGDSGFKTRIEWALPQGASAGDIQWPVPSRFTLGPITNYGYENTVILLSPITVPKDAKAGGSFPVKAKVSWLVCKDICIPQHVELGLILPIAVGRSAPRHDNPLIKQALAMLPQASPWPVQTHQIKDGLSLRIAATGLQLASPQKIWFYADQPGKVAHGATQDVQIDGNAVVLKLRSGDMPAAVGEHLTGVLAIAEKTRDGDVVRGYAIDTTLDAAATDGIETSRAVVLDRPEVGFASALLLALLGGLILNLMPCVFPVLSIKALSLLDHAQQTRRQARLHGLFYALGVLVSFALLGIALIALKAGGAQIGWGFQFQSPAFVLIAAYLMFAVGLSLSGVFSIGASVAGVGSSLAERPGYSGSFFSGMLATIVATPCTAPFMGGALGYALTQPPAKLMAVFLSLGLGLALPYLLLSHWPLLQRWLPRPGLWMERVKQVLAFPMYGAGVWLIWVLAQQAGINAVAIALGGMVTIAFAAWLFETTRVSSSLVRNVSVACAILAVATALASGYIGIKANAIHVENFSSAKEISQPYSAERLHALRAQGAPVFVNLTAAWCITCLVNERVALDQDSVSRAFHDAGITYLKGDWTNQDIHITRQLAEFGRSGVPLYVFYPIGIDSTPVVLPQLLTPDTVIDALKTPSSSHRIAS